MITVIGSLNVDFNLNIEKLPEKGETIGSNSFDISYGGKGGNQAIAASRLGSKVNFIGAIGADDYGKTYLNILRDEGVNTDNITEIEDKSTGLAVVLLSNNDNSIIIAPEANYELTTKEVEKHRETIINSDFVLIQFEIPPETINKVIEIAYENNVPIVLNPAPFTMFPHEWLEKITYFTPNEIEYEAYRNSELYHPKYEHKMVVTLGANGVSYVENNEKYIIPTPTVDVKDTTGAGDTFNGALVTALSKGVTLGESCEIAVKAASISTTKIGAQTGMPTFLEINKLKN